MKHDGGPAFPVPSNTLQMLPDKTLLSGMTLRDYFAAHAPQPPVTWRGGEWMQSGTNALAAYIAWRWYYADTMLAERAQ